jgi:formylglycine-generating enzyme required for sulfatase activity
VRITKPFYLGVYEVTQAQYARVMGRNPSYFAAPGAGEKEVAGLKTARFPVETVTWYDAVEFCNRLSEKEGLPAYYRLSAVERNRLTTWERQALAHDPQEAKMLICIVSAHVQILEGPGYRLPAEAEWEYACRAGTTTPFSFGAVLNGREANCEGRNPPYGTQEKGPSLRRPAVVGCYSPNAFGLYDMHGNVEEWCADWYDARYYRASPIDDPAGPESPESKGAWWVPFPSRVVRGGCWFLGPGSARSAFRAWDAPGSRAPTMGFRVARDYSPGDHPEGKKSE